MTSAMRGPSRCRKSAGDMLRVRGVSEKRARVARVVVWQLPVVLSHAAAKTMKAARRHAQNAARTNASGIGKKCSQHLRAGEGAVKSAAPNDGDGRQ